MDELLADERFVSASTPAQRENMLASGPDDEDVSVQVVVPEEPSRLDEFVLMRTRVGHEPIELGGDGVVLSEKLADQLGVGVGDEVALTEQDAIGNATGSSHAATVTGVMENYIYNYVFIGPRPLRRAHGRAAFLHHPPRRRHRRSRHARAADRSGLAPSRACGPSPTTTRRSTPIARCFRA